MTVSRRMVLVAVLRPIIAIEGHVQESRKQAVLDRWLARRTMNVGFKAVWSLETDSLLPIGQGS